ncbi:hypothetical protein F5Y17DRAFT_477533 [Xylariaceae sp. FL0594]|nr:hypothetical protein F5Y17DRAFT_477533 [Xylariaceae sp. FL0594]
MYLSSLLSVLALAFASVGIASPLAGKGESNAKLEARVKPVHIEPRDGAPSVRKTWTISEVTRQSSGDNTVCKWHIHLSDSTPSSASLAKTTSKVTNLADTATPVPLPKPVSNNDDDAGTFMNFSCDFAVTVPEGKDCRMEEFTGPTCLTVTTTSNDDKDSEVEDVERMFRANAGHSEMGFVVMVVTDEDEGLRAYFGFDDSALDAGFAIPPQTSVVMTSIFDPPDDDTAAVDDKASKGDEGDIKKRDDPPSFPPFTGITTIDDDGRDVNNTITIRDMSRVLDNVLNTMTLSFKIHKSDPTKDDDDDDSDIPCKVVAEAYPGTDLKTWQWYDRQCTGSEYWVSWGYIAESDAGIMTLVSPTRDSESFFGFANISKSEILGESGPSQVYPCACGSASKM